MNNINIIYFEYLNCQILSFNKESKPSKQFIILFQYENYYQLQNFLHYLNTLFMLMNT